MRRLAPLAFALLVLSCGGPGYDAPTSGPPAIGNPTTEDQTCSRDAECVLVADCCGCDRSGRQLAVRRDRLEALESSASTECASVSCPVARSEHRSCQTERARCLGGRCVPAVD